jgi:hypothetical protein
VAHNFKTGNNKIKLFTEYENVIQSALIPLVSILQAAEQFQNPHPS